MIWYVFYLDPRLIVVTPRAEADRVCTQHALSDRYVLYFGSSKLHKNAPRLIEAFAKLGSGMRDRGSSWCSRGIGMNVIRRHQRWLNN
jgi:hypothetical protein